MRYVPIYRAILDLHYSVSLDRAFIPYISTLHSIYMTALRMRFATIYILASQITGRNFFADLSSDISSGDDLEANISFSRWQA